MDRDQVLSLIREELSQYYLSKKPVPDPNWLAARAAFAQKYGTLVKGIVIAELAIFACPLVIIGGSSLLYQWFPCRTTFRFKTWSIQHESSLVLSMVIGMTAATFTSLWGQANGI